MNFTCKPFSELSARELFEIYKLRAEVFVVEQNCVYQDVDDKDLSALHVMLYHRQQLIGYSRILMPGTSYKEPSIGRVVVKKDFRLTGAGKELMKYNLDQIRKDFKDQDVVISAQAYLERFYSEFGFIKEGAPYLEDEIPHLKMRLVAH